MDDIEVVAAIAAGELDGLAAALDRYAVPLFEYCRAMAPEVAAEAVHDTFVVAWCRADGLSDPGRLYPWLQAVAGNECFRRTLAGGPAAASAGVASAGVAPEPALPPGLPGQVLSACADNTPAGRAYRVSVTHRAGPFGHDGFPKANGQPGAWRRRLWPGRRPGAVVAAVTAAAVLAITATAIAVIAPGGGSRHGPASAAGADQRSTAAAQGQGAALPTTPAQPIPDPSSPTTAAPAGSTPTAGRPAGLPEVSPPVVPMATLRPQPPPSAPVPAAQGFIAVGQPKLTLVSHNGGTSAQTFTITAAGGPVTGYTIAVPAGLPGSLTVSPTSGSLPAGGSATVTVTAASAVPFVTTLTVHPGGDVIVVVVKANPGDS